MDLHSGDLYWPRTCSPLRAGRRPGVSRTRVEGDVLIIGGGITGALAASELTRAGRRVIVADRRPMGAGSTAATTALVQAEIDVSLLDLREKVGERQADAAYQTTRAALDELRCMAKVLGVECDMAGRPSVQLAPTAEVAEQMWAEVAARQSIGLRTLFLSRSVLAKRFGFDAHGAILSDLAFELNPLKLTRALLASAAAGGAVLLANTMVDLTPLTNSLAQRAFVTDGGLTLVAGTVIIATGYETPEQFPLVARLTKFKTTFAAATVPLTSDPWPERAVVWEKAEPYFYARCAPDGRVILGGEDIEGIDPAKREKLLVAKGAILQKKLRKLAPKANAPFDSLWTGTFAETSDGLPFIGGHKAYPGALFALGYGGNGITYSMIASQLLRDMVVGAENESAQLFRFDRATTVSREEKERAASWRDNPELREARRGGPERGSKHQSSR